MFATYVTMLTPMSFAGEPTPRELFELPGAAMETAGPTPSPSVWRRSQLNMSEAAVRWRLGALGLVFLGLETREFAGTLSENAGPARGAATRRRCT